jgi:hypothetical protein
MIWFIRRCGYSNKNGRCCNGNQGKQKVPEEGEEKGICHVSSQLAGMTLAPPPCTRRTHGGHFYAVIEYTNERYIFLSWFLSLTLCSWLPFRFSDNLRAKLSVVQNPTPFRQQSTQDEDARWRRERKGGENPKTLISNSLMPLMPHTPGQTPTLNSNTTTFSVLCFEGLSWVDLILIPFQIYGKIETWELQHEAKPWAFFSESLTSD